MRAGGILCGVAIMAALGAGASEGEVKVGGASNAFKDWAKAQKLQLGGDANQGPEAYFVAEVTGPKAGGWMPEKAWDKAKALKFVFLDQSGDKPQAPTEAKVLTCGGVLHFRFECQDPDAKHLAYSSTGRDSSDLWRDDCIEIRLRPDGAKSEKGPHFILNPAGALFDADANGDVSWDPPARRRARIHEKGWTVELSVPLRALAAEGDMPVAWPANFVRCRQGREDALAEETAWRSTGALEGKNPDFFGWLYLEAVERKLPAPPAESFQAAGDDLLKVYGNSHDVVTALGRKYFCPASVASVLEKPPALDGGFTDPAWQKAEALSLEPLNEAIHPAEIEATEARVLLGDGRLYIGVRCAERDVKSIVAQDRPDGKDVFRDDSAEIFLAPGRKESADYRQIVVNPLGSFYAGRGKKPASREGIVVKTKTGASEWTAEIEVPFENLGLKAGEVPALWGFNVIRNRAPRSGEPEQASAWSLPYSWTVHNPARFGSLWLPKAAVFPDIGDADEIQMLRLQGRTDAAEEGKIHVPDAVARNNWDVFDAGEREKLELRTMTDRFMRGILDRQYAARDQELEGVKTWDDWLKIRERIRKAFAASVGGFPAERTDLNPRTQTAFENDEIRIEKVIYESRPKFYVTANLYLPMRSAGKKVPAIVRVVGHSTRGRLSGFVVSFSEELARRGYAVLAIDSLGQGERMYINGGHGSRTPTTNHYFQGAACTLTGANLAGYMIWDVMRGIDYLETRPEIDMSRVVMTGSSGGGTLTSYVAALEDRLFGAAPVSAVGSNRKGGGNYDSEQVLYGTSRDGIDGEGRTAAVAPRPIAVISEVGSDESLEANKAAFEVSRKAFNLKDAGAKLEYVPTKHPHGYGPPHQKLFLEWVLRTMPPNADYPEAKGKADYAIKDLYASKSWRAFFSRELADRETVWSLNSKRMTRELSYEKGVGSQKDAEARAEAIRKKLRELLVLEGDTFDPVKVTEHGRETVEGIVVEKLVLETEPGVFVPAVYLWDPKVKADKKTPAILWLLGRGKRSLLKGRWKELAENLKAGASILVPDLRGTGETSPSVDESYLGDETSLNGYGLRIAHPLIGMRVRDALACVAYLRSRGDVLKDRVAIVGDSLAKTNPAEIRQPRIETDAGLEPLYRAESLGPAVALLAFALDEKLCAAYTRGGLASYASICERPYFYHPFASFVPGILQHFDVADLCAACAPRRLVVEGPVDGRNRRLTMAELGTSFKDAAKAYGLYKIGDGDQQESAGDKFRCEEHPQRPSATMLELYKFGRTKAGGGADRY